MATNERTLTPYHMGVAFERLGLTIGNRGLRTGQADVERKVHGRVVGRAHQLEGGDWRVVLHDESVGRDFSKLELY